MTDATLTKKNIEHYKRLSYQTGFELTKPSPKDVDFSLMRLEDRFDYLRIQAIPIRKTKTLFIIATINPDPRFLNQARVFFSQHTYKKLKFILITNTDFNALLAKKFKKHDPFTIANIRDIVDEKHSAAHNFSFLEKIILLSLIIFIFYSAFANFFYTALWVNLFLACGTLTLMTYKLGLTLHSIRYFFKKRKQETTPKLNRLPIYTILIPLLDEEASTISLLIEALQRFDYPKNKLDIKFLLEAHDKKTQEALTKFDLPWNYQILIVPPGLPRSKPRACNYGLRFALGEYLTIYDAEDRPDSDQLKRALGHLQVKNTDVVCVQASLNFYNYRENIIARLFTIEYTHWFDCLVPALSSLFVPVPLGGTSNHFKTSILREVGGWDPFVGTEDAEIGVRLYRKGYRVVHISSTTYEEANTRFLNWFRQRARWNKGYMQTYLVNMRDPIKMIQQIGLWPFLHFQLFVGGNVFFQLANLPLWIFLFSTLFFYNDPIMQYYPKMLLHLCWFNFLISNMTLLVSQFIATYHRRLYCLLPFVPLKLIYWLCMSFASYYAVYHLLFHPGYWYKTKHNVSKQGKNTDVPISQKRKSGKKHG